MLHYRIPALGELKEEDYEFSSTWDRERERWGGLSHSKTCFLKSEREGKKP